MLSVLLEVWKQGAGQGTLVGPGRVAGSGSASQGPCQGRGPEGARGEFRPARRPGKGLKQGLY